MQPDVHLLSSWISKIALYVYPCLCLCILIRTTLQAFFPNKLCAYINCSSGFLQNSYSSCAHISNSYNISPTYPAFIMPTYIPRIPHILILHNPTNLLPLLPPPQLPGPFQSSPLIIDAQPQPNSTPDKICICRHMSKCDKLHPSTNDYVNSLNFPTHFGPVSEVCEIVSLSF
jgi:hypothetical protein